jgi:N6-adenosine-specific RNA methylase IME4
MSIEKLCEMPVAAHATPDAVLLMWATAPMLLQNPGPREVLEAWGFTYKSNQVWNKVLGMPGHYGMQVVHEHLIIATRGSCTPDHNAPVIPSVLTERRGDEHSGKPESVRKWIESKWDKGNRLELFSREQHEGWTTYGNDPRLWQQSA